jgi:ribosomal protein S6
MAKYELMLILNPSVSEEERNNTLLRLKKVFEENSVQIEQEDIW